ncbi:MAG: DUF2339 domain-containing protein [Polyangiaceae bacterium]
MVRAVLHGIGVNVLELFLLCMVFVEAAAIAALFTQLSTTRGRIERVEQTGAVPPPVLWQYAQAAVLEAERRRAWVPWPVFAPEPRAPARAEEASPPAPREAQLSLPFETAAVQLSLPFASLAPMSHAADESAPRHPSLAGAAGAAREDAERAPTAAAPERPSPVEKGASPPDESAKPPIDWERWLGVRGAAAVGAVLLVVALLYFLRYSIDAGWLTVAARVELGAAVSALVVIGARIRLPRTHAVLSSWMSGAGIAGLYASAWAGAWLAHLYGPVVAFGLGVTITVGAVVLALHAGSLPIALLGFVGAFAAPLALISGDESVAAVVVYIVMLDVGAVVLALKKRWWSLALLSVVVSAAYEAVFLLARGGDGLMPLHFGIAVAFAVLFGLSPTVERARRAPADPDAMPAPIARAVTYAALVASFGLAAPLALRLPFGVAGLSLLGLLFVLTGTAAALARRESEPGLAVLAALANTGVLFVWSLFGAPSESAPIAVAIAAVALPLPLVALVASFARGGANEPREARARVPLGAVLLSVLGGLSLVCVTAFRTGGSIGWAVGAVAALSAALVAGAAFADDVQLVNVAVSGLAVTCGVLGLARWEAPGVPLVAAVAASAIAAVAAAVTPARIGALAPETLASAARASAIAAAAALAPHVGRLDFTIFAALLSGVVAILVATRPVGGGASAIAVGPIAAALLLARAHLAASGAGPVLPLGAGLSTAILVGPWAVARIRGGAQARLADAQAAALAAFAVAFLAAPAAESASASHTVPLLVVGVLATTLLAVHVRFGGAARAEVSLGLVGAAAMIGAAGTGFAHEYAPLTLALLGAASIAGRRFAPHRSLLALGVGAITLAGLGVAPNPNALTFHARGSIPFLNWTLLAWGLPTAAAALVIVLLSREVLARTAAGEAAHPWLERARGAAVVAALGLVFSWLNVIVLDAFGTGPVLSLASAWTRSKSLRDLTMSGAWAAFGVGLLLVGMKQGSGALRKVSLGAVLLTIAKVFLYDLSALENLYRVASLVGLAVSLIGISLLYQRFVFRSRTAESRTVEPRTGEGSSQG